MLVDWLTLRAIIDTKTSADLAALIPYLHKQTKVNMETGEIVQQKYVVDVDAVKSSFPGMVWSLSNNESVTYLNIGASPATLKNGYNLFGHIDYQTCKQILLDHVQQVLPINVNNFVWQPRRIDITQNYYMQSNAQVNDALLTLRSMDGMRQKATVQAGNTVYWGAKSRFRKGKAYDKFLQALEICRKFYKKGEKPPYTETQLHLMQSILRLEMTLGSQFFDDFINKKNPTKCNRQIEDLLTIDFFEQQHNDFFGKFIGNAEVTDMDKLLEKLIETAPSIGYARAAHYTYMLINKNGYEHTKLSMPERTFRKHRQYLKAAGLSEADITSAKIIELRKRKIIELQPVNDWQHLQQLNQEAA